MKTKISLLLSLLFICSTSPQFIFSNTITSYFSDPQPTLIETLQEGESYTIEITSIGCFHGSRQTITISKKNDILTASLQDSKKLLTATDIETLKQFEIQLKQLDLAGCTTVDTYVLRYNDKTFRTSDGSCSWHGYRKLIELFE